MANTGMSLWLLLNQAENLIQQGDQRGARAMFEQGMMVAAAADDPWMTALTYIRSGTTHVRLGEIEKALLYYGRGADALRGKGNDAPPPAEATPVLAGLLQEPPPREEDAPLMVRGLSRLTKGMAARRAGNFALAEAELRAAIALLEQEGDPVNRAAARLELAVVLNQTGRDAESEPLYHDAVDLARGAKHAGLLCDALHDLGVSLREWGRLPEAERAFSEGAGVARSAGDRWNEARLRTMLGVTLLDQGQKIVGYGQMTVARPLAEDAGPRHSLAICWRVEGQRLKGQGSYQQARECLEYAASLLAGELGVGAERERAGCLRDLGDVALASGDTAEAKNLYAQSLDLYSRSAHAARQAEVLLALGNVSREEGDAAGAYSYYTKAARHARAQGNSRLMGQCHVEAAQLRAMNGRVPEAQWDLTCARALFAESDLQLVSDVDTTLANIRGYNPAAYDQLAHAFNVRGLGDIWSLTPP
jgi:tetratricopeptide (TPR) repeat protein